MTSLSFILIALAVIVLVIVMASYVKAPPAIAFIISGLSKTPRVLIGKGGFRIPFFERLDKVYLGQISVDIKTGNPVPTRDFINVDVDAVAKIRVVPNEEGIRLAAKNFLNMTPDLIAHQLKDSLQGNMREIVGTLDLKALNTDRDGFSDEVLKKATPDMAKLGIEVISCNIQDVTDQNNLIKDLGADNTYKIKKDAAIAKAQAEREIAVEQSQAAKEANDARVAAETAIAEKNNELAIRKADLKGESDTRQAVADAAYKIQEQEQARVIKVKTVEAVAAEEITRAERLKEINAKTVEAEIEKTNRLQKQKELEVTIMQRELEAKVNKKADADKYQVEVQAAADLEQRKREAEAKRYEAEQEALAIKAQAEAKRYEAEQEAAGIRAQGEAEAYAIGAKGVAEAEAMNKKAEAYKNYNGAALADMIVQILPEMAGKVSEAVKSIDGIRIYGTDGKGLSEVSGAVPVLIQQTMDTVSEATGVDMRGIIRANSIEAKTDRNIDVALSDKDARKVKPIRK